MKKIDAMDYVAKDLAKKTGYKIQKVISLLTDDNPMTPEEIFESVKKVSKNSPRPVDSKELVGERMKEKKLEKIAPSTGLANLDEHIKGFIPGHLYLMSGDTNVGKTSLACNFAIAVAMQKKRVLYLALEPDNTVIDYLASIVTKKWFDNITKKDYSSIPDGIDIYKKDKVDTQKKMLKFISECERYDLIIIDHFGYFITSEHNSNQEQSNKVKQLVGLAKSKKSAVMFIQHLNKGTGRVKQTVFGKERIMGSSALYQDATEVLVAIRDTFEDDPFKLSYKNTGHILIMKTKSGKSGSVRIGFHSGGATIKSIEDDFKPF